MDMEGEPFKSPGPVAASSNRTMNLETAGSTPRFLIIKKIDGTDFSKDNPFAINKIIYGLIGQPKNIRKIKEGLLIETISLAQSIRLSKVERFGELAVEVTPHKVLNYSKGVITCRDFLNCTIEEIVDGLKPAGVIEARRITSRINGEVRNTPNLILTFNQPRLPTSIKTAFYSLKVRPYIPAPLRCFRCQCFGHTSTQCSKPQVCVCGLEPHEGSPCKTPITCVNCGEQHSARSRECSVYKFEQAVQKLKTEERIPYMEARRRLQQTTPNIRTTYAHITKTHSGNDLKEIIKQMIPEITNICTMIIKERIEKNTENITQVSQMQSNTAFQMSRTSSISSEKRKRPDTQVSNEETSENEGSSSTSRSYQSKGKKKPGRPRKPPEK